MPFVYMCVHLGLSALGLRADTVGAFWRIKYPDEYFGWRRWINSSKNNLMCYASKNGR
jgi:hypothetical protein